jgi:hypothetical protein
VWGGGKVHGQCESGRRAVAAGAWAAAPAAGAAAARHRPRPGPPPPTAVQAPRACENFLALCASHYYDGVTFHRNIKGFSERLARRPPRGFGGSARGPRRRGRGS